MSTRSILALCLTAICLLVLSGCKSSQPFGFATKTPESSTDSIASTQRDANPVETVRPEQPTTWKDSLRTAINWAPFRRSNSKSEQLAAKQASENRAANPLADRGQTANSKSSQLFNPFGPYQPTPQKNKSQMATAKPSTTGLKPSTTGLKTSATGLKASATGPGTSTTAAKYPSTAANSPITVAKSPPTVAKSDSPLAKNGPPVSDPSLVASSSPSIATSSPSLVRRSRRPPPDPAPKLPQTQLTAGSGPTDKPTVQESHVVDASKSASQTSRVDPNAAAGSGAEQAKLPSSRPAHELAAENVKPQETVRTELTFSPPNLQKQKAVANSPSAADLGVTGEKKQSPTSSTPPMDASARDKLLASRAGKLNRNTQERPDSQKATPTAPSSSTAVASQWVAKKTASSISAHKGPSRSVFPVPRPSQRKEIQPTETLVKSSSKKDSPNHRNTPVADTFAQRTTKPGSTGDAGNKPASALASRSTMYRSSAFRTNSTLAAEAQPSQAAARVATKYPSTEAQASNVPVGQILAKPEPATKRVSAVKTNLTPKSEPDYLARYRALASKREHEPLARTKIFAAKPKTSPKDYRSYQSYYRHGVLPGSSLMPRSSSTAKPPVESTVKSTVKPTVNRGGLKPPVATGVTKPVPTAVVNRGPVSSPAAIAVTARPPVAPSVNRPVVPSVNPPVAALAQPAFAPVVDADAYRKSLAESGRQPATTVSHSRPEAADGTWLNTYQNLIREARRPAGSPPPPPDAVKRNVNSEARQSMWR